MSQHTPGPWEINGQGWDVYVASTADPDTTICKVEVLSDGEGDTSVTIRNANLIAAAPDLLAACELAFDEMMRNDFGTLTIVPKILVAIHKARGQ